MPLITQSARLLEMVARYGSIRRAAERVNAAPSAVNRQILNLEAELGTLLFERVPRGMRLTEAGKLLVDQIRAWQRDYERARASVEGLKGRNGELVRIGVMECLAADFLPRAFGELQQEHPDATMRAVVDGTAEIASQLLSNEIDLAVAFNMPRDTGLKIVQEIRVELGAVMPPSHRLAREREVPLSALLEYPLVLADGTLSIRPIVDAMLERTRRPAAEAVVTNSIIMLKSMVMRGAGVGVLTSVDVYSEVKAGQLHFAPIAGARVFELLSVSVRDTKALNPSAVRMAEIVSSAMDKLTQPISGNQPVNGIEPTTAQRRRPS
jgi:DNA-binding transcriptional LysR family regulator